MEPGAAARRRSINTKVLAVVGMIVALFVGVGIGASGKTQTIHDTQTVTVTKTPASCVQALDYAGTGFGYASKITTTVTQALTDAGNLDSAALNHDAASINGVNAQLNALAPKYVAARDECEAQQ